MAHKKSQEASAAVPMSKEQKLERKKEIHIKNVYNSRRTTAVDKFLEQAIMRCSMKGGVNTAHNPSNEVKPLTIQ